MSVFKRILKIVGTVILTFLLAGMIFSCIFAVYVKTYLQSQIDFSMESFSLNQTSVILYWDEEKNSYEELQKLYGSENRTLVSYDKIPADLRFATVAIEDKRFFVHHGVDWLRTARAGVNLFLGDENAFGASTITQQLVKNLTGKEEVTVRRKLVEIFTALELAKQYSRDEVLEWYLNTIYMGEGCYGVQAAAQNYFGKNVSDLSLAECASLISITNNPSIYDPYVHPDKNRERQLNVLYAMLEQGYIDQSEYDEAKNEQLTFHRMSASDQKEAVNSEYYSYFVDQVIYDVVGDLMKKTGLSYDDAYELLTTGGYKIYSTIDRNVQEQLDAVYGDLNNVPETASSQQLQSAMVILDNETCNVVAIAGGVGDKGGSLVLNRATQSMLSPGSTIKPISVFAPALELGILTPATVYDDTPFSFGDRDYWPKNSDRTFRGLVSVNEAMGLSLNTVAVKIVDQLTPEYCFDFAKNRMGLSGLVQQYESGGQIYSDAELSPMAMGSLTVGVSVEDVTAAYAAFANGGAYRPARTYTKVTNSKGNEVILENTQTAMTAMNQNTAWYITDMLQDAVRNGTGAEAALSNMPVAGKTGTTTSDNDRWFAGYTPYYTAVTWCGYDQPEEIVLTSGTTNPAIVLWNKVMERVHAELSYKEFQQPSEIITCSYCRDSGLLATDACRADPRGDRVVEGKLSIYDVPTGYCTCHKMEDICEASGQLANSYCYQVPNHSIRKVGLLNLTRAFPTSGIVVQDQQYCIASNPVPDGYYPALSSVVRPIAESCPVHTQDSILPEPEPEPEPEPDPEPGIDPEPEPGGTEIPPAEENPPEDDRPWWYIGP